MQGPKRAAMKYNILATGSKGNATIIEDCILIDCGVPFKALKPYYRDLKLVLCSHCHGDHFNRRTITRIANERPMLRFGCCEWLVAPLVECGVQAKNIDVYEREIEPGEAIATAIEPADLLRAFRKEVYGLRGRIVRSKSLATSVISSICPHSEAQLDADIQRLLSGSPEAWNDAHEAYGPAILALTTALEPDHTTASERRRRQLAGIRPRIDAFAEEEGRDA